MDREIPPWFREPPPGGGGPDAGGDHTAGTLIVALVLAALTMAFGVVLVLYFHSWAAAPQWPPLGAPRLPRGLWLSTAVLLASSVTMQYAWHAARTGRWRRLRRAMAATLALALVFLLSQVVNWGLAVLARMPPGASQYPQYATVFYLFTGLHALHVLGGLVPLALVTARSRRGVYSPADHAGVTWMAMYWHFVGAVWIVLYAVLLAGQRDIRLLR